MEKNQDDQRPPSIESADEKGGIEDSNKTVNATDIDSTQPNAIADEHEFITGLKLWAVLASVTLVLFLTMLDMSIIATVSVRMEALGSRLLT